MRQVYWAGVHASFSLSQDGVGPDGGREVGESWERGGRVVGDVIVNMCTVPATTAICFVHVKALGRLII